MKFLAVVLFVCVQMSRINAQECVCTCTTTPISVITTAIPVETTPAETEEPTTEISSTPGCSAAPCDEINGQIAVDASNNTFLTTSLNEAFATWNTTEQNTFRGYKKRIEVIVYQGTTSTDSEEEQIAKVVSGFTTNPARAKMVYDVQIACWGTIRQFVECVNQIYGTNYKIW